MRLIASVLLSTSLASVPQTRVLNGADLLWARSLVHDGSDAVLNASYAQLQKRAEKAQAAPLQSVVNKTLQIPGVSPHNYVSVGIYNHPCNDLPVGCVPYPGSKPLPPSQCDNATGLPWEPCDGIRNQAAITAGDSPSQSAMMTMVQDTALAAFYAKDADVAKAFVGKAAQALRTWFLDDSTAMLPNLYYGQIVPLKSPPKKGHGGFIEWAHTARFLDHVELLRFVDSKGEVWTESDDLDLRKWFAAFLSYVESPEAQGERRMTNNHASWYDVTWQSVALFAGKNSSAEVAAREVNDERIAKQILPNGTEWIEVQRNVPSGYCQYNLQALAEDADLAASHGKVDVWGFATADGRSLRKALDWLLPYAVENSTWPYKQPEAPNWTKLWEPLRRAAAAYDNPYYEEAACLIMAAAGKSKGYHSDPFNLRMPPRHRTRCEAVVMV